MSEQPSRDTLEIASQILKTTPLCDQCLGRQFAWLSTDTTNRSRGQSIKLVLSMIADEKMKSDLKSDGIRLIQLLATNGMYDPARKLAKKYGLSYEPIEHCTLCTITGISLFDKIPDLTDKARNILKEYEFESFLVGTIPSSELTDIEDELRARFSLLYGESLKSDFNREFGKTLQNVIQKEVEFEKPDIVVIYDMLNDSIALQVNPMFIFGRYRKLKRGIPQSRWDCGECNGKGCEACGGTGRKYPDSISEYIGNPTMKALGGSRFKFHAAGREDIDVLMLGSGRPFVVEISEPHIRNLELTELAEQINQQAEGKVEVLDLEFSERNRAQNLKEKASESVKEYEAIIEVEDNITDDALRAAELDLTDCEINQRTPNRVAHRRSDLIRKKHIHEIRLKKKDDQLLECYFRVQGGTYVKELISGDDGRTVPSLAEKLGTPCTCVKLDVLAVHTTHHNP